MSLEENREKRPVRKKRKLRWGRLVFVLLVLAALLTGAFWGTVWVYDTFISPPKVDVIGASDKIAKDEKLNKRINIRFWVSTMAIVKPMLTSRSGQML